MNIPNFNNKEIFERVFTHRSFLNESSAAKNSNERLEFLGDSILSYVVSTHIFNHYPELNEGQLTNLRAILTNTQTLYELSSELGTGKHLRLSKGEEDGGGRKNKSILADTFEAIIGGLYIDQGIEAASDFIHGTVLSRIEEIIKSQGLKDAKSTLQEILQEKYKTSPVYSIIKEEGPDHARTFTIQVLMHDTVLGEGVGHSKQEAEKNAAKNALENKEIAGK